MAGKEIRRVDDLRGEYRSLTTDAAIMLAPSLAVATKAVADHLKDKSQQKQSQTRK
jgi:hypothetical protein